MIDSTSKKAEATYAERWAHENYLTSVRLHENAQKMEREAMARREACMETWLAAVALCDTLGITDADLHGVEA